MATTGRQSLRDEIRSCNDCLDQQLRARFSMTLRTYKTVKAIGQLAAFAVAYAAIQHGAEPLTVFVGVVLIWGGPEYLEVYLAEGGPSGDNDSSEN